MVRCWRTSTLPPAAIDASDPLRASSSTRSRFDAGRSMRCFRGRFTRSLERHFALRFLDDVLAGALPLPAERFIRDGGRECAAGRSRQVERCQQSVEFHALGHPPIRPGMEQPPS